MKQMNKEVYNVEPDGLIYDFCRPVDAININVTLEAGKGGILKRGQLIDFADGSYTPHQADGAANCIVSDDTVYTATDNSVVVSVYICGNFRTDRVISDVDLTETDIDNLRIHGILLK